MIIRTEKNSDYEAITKVTIEAFKDHPISRQTEHFIVNALRRSGALTVSLVAESDGRVIGHIAFSPITASDGSENWYGMGPVSVSPDCQKQGIGIALVNQGLSELKGLGSQGCALVGPPDYYNRFGFKNYPEMIHEGVPPEVFLALPFNDITPKGIIKFHEGFAAEN